MLRDVGGGKFRNSQTRQPAFLGERSYATDSLIFKWELVSSSVKGQASLVAETVKNLPAMLKTWVPSLDREGPLEKKMATHSNILARRIPWTEEPGGLQSVGRKESDTTEWLTSSLFSQSQVLEPAQGLDGLGCGYPLQYSCLENPMDGGTWRTTVHGVVKSQTQLSMHAGLWFKNGWARLSLLMGCDWTDSPDRLLPQPEAADQFPPGPILLANRAFDMQCPWGHERPTL